MSYCRWSSDVFRCDVYAYEDENGFVIHVAARKREIPLDWVDPLEKFNKLDPAAWAEEYRKFHLNLQELPHRDLTAPSAGQSFFEPELEDFRDRMLALRAEGLRFPDYVLAAIAEEIAERDQGGPSLPDPSRSDAAA